MSKLNHEESVEILLLFIASQVAIIATGLNKNISESMQDSIIKQFQDVAKVIKLDKANEMKFTIQ